MSDWIVRKQVDPAYDKTLTEFVSSMNASNIDLITSTLVKEIPLSEVESLKGNIQKQFGNIDIVTLKPISINYGKAPDEAPVGVDFSLTSKDGKILVRTGFIEQDGKPKIAIIYFADKKDIGTADSFLNMIWNPASTIIILIFIAVYLTIVTAASKVVQDQPKRWILWLIAILGFGITNIEISFITARWDYNLLYPVFGFPIIRYKSHEFYPLVLELCVPVVAIIYLTIRKKLKHT